MTVMLLENTPAVLSLGKISTKNLGTVTIGRTSHQEKQENSLRHTKSCTIRRASLSTSSSSLSTSPTSSSQDIVTDTEVPATRSESAGEDPSARGNSWHEPIEIGKKL